MKKFKYYLLFLTGLFLLTNCSKSDEVWTSPTGDQGQKKHMHALNSPGIDQDRFITLPYNSLRVHYRIIGKGPVNVVLIPGWTNPLEIYQKQFDYLRDKARCIYVDLPGQGQSDAPMEVEYTLELMADAIYEIVKKEGMHKFAAVGFSMGPVVLGEFERKYPGMITRLANIDGSFTPWPPEGDPSRPGFITAREDFISYIQSWTETEKMGFASMLLTPDSPEDLVDFVEYFSDYPSWLMANIYKHFSAEAVNLPVGWKFPILCMYTHSVTDMDYHQLYFPGAQIETFEGSGHVIQWEKMDEVNPLLWEFINDKNYKMKPGTVRLPFKVEYVGEYTAQFISEKCGEDPNYNIIVDGEGNGTHVGESTIHFDFCFDASTGIYGNQDSYIVASNGDTLFISCEGQVIEGRLPEHPDDVNSWWKDPFVILGGTGKFEGATGSGMTDDYNWDRDPYSHHHWEGTIVLNRGKTNK